MSHLEVGSESKEIMPIENDESVLGTGAKGS